ncbi:MAG TPA: endospore germination permease [Symbiobacteriaceae bacterium]|jgi:spore germination protein (amino acid permease)|nr:endospore germination permease [Symbiobacteriaceae bacterium]
MIQEEGHIGLLQGVVLLYAVLSAKLFVQYPSVLIDAGGPAAWQATVVMTAVGLLLFLPMGALARRFPGKALYAISEEVAGPVLGFLITLTVTVWLALSVTVSLRNLTETYITTLLPNTPPSVLTMVAIGGVAYASYRGVESLSRTTQILLPIIIAGLVLLLLFSLPRTDPSRLYPFWGHGVAQTVSGGAFAAGMLADSIVLLAVGYSFRQGKILQRAGYLAILLFGLLATWTVAMLVMTFGAPDAAQQPIPLFNLAQLIYLGRFVQRMEAVLVMFWFFSMAVRLAALFHASVICLTGALRLPYYRPVVFPMAVITMALSMLPEDLVMLIRIMRDWITPLGIGISLVPLLLLVLALIRGKRGESHAA